jgi:hypothetical protein
VEPQNNTNRFQPALRKYLVMNVFLFHWWILIYLTHS